MPRLNDDCARLLSLFPAFLGATTKGQRRWLYAVGFGDGRVKFGIAADVRGRLRSYWRDVGGAIAWLHVFGTAPNDPEWGSRTSARHPAEKIAIQRASKLGEQIGRSEYVRGLSKEQALQCMRLAIAEVRETVEA